MSRRRTTAAAGTRPQPDVVALSGFLNRWNDSMATVLEAPAAEIAAAHLAVRGWQVGKHEAG